MHNNIMVTTRTITIPMTKLEAAKTKSKSKEKNIELHYTSITSSQPVVNAVTGSPYPFNMGTRDMFRCYMVTTTLHHPRTRQRIIKPTKNRKPIKDVNEKETIRLFYDSPDQYEQHMDTTLSDEIVKRWNNIQQEIADGSVTSNGKLYSFKLL
jgi:hypothetical protein